MDVERLGHEGGELLEDAIADGGQRGAGLAGGLMEGGFLEWGEGENGDMVGFGAIAESGDTGGDVGGFGDEVDEDDEGGVFLGGFGEVGGVGQDEDTVTQFAQAVYELASGDEVLVSEERERLHHRSRVLRGAAKIKGFGIRASSGLISGPVGTRQGPHIP